MYFLIFVLFFMNLFVIGNLFVQLLELIVVNGLIPVINWANNFNRPTYNLVVNKVANHGGPDNVSESSDEENDVIDSDTDEFSDDEVSKSVTETAIVTDVKDKCDNYDKCDDCDKCECNDDKEMVYPIKDSSKDVIIEESDEKFDENSENKKVYIDEKLD